jgi:hypothetical protein
VINEGRSRDQGGAAAFAAGALKLMRIRPHGVALDFRLVGKQRTWCGAPPGGESRSGTDPPYRPTPNIGGRKLAHRLANRLPSHTGQACLSNLVVTRLSTFPNGAARPIRPNPRRNDAQPQEGRAQRLHALLLEVLSPRIPSRGRRVVSPTGATAVTHTTVRALGDTRGPAPFFGWAYGAVHPNCRNNRNYRRGSKVGRRILVLQAGELIGPTRVRACTSLQAQCFLTWGQTSVHFGESGS